MDKDGSIGDYPDYIIFSHLRHTILPALSAATAILSLQQSLASFQTVPTERFATSEGDGRHLSGLLWVLIHDSDSRVRASICSRKMVIQRN